MIVHSAVLPRKGDTDYSFRKIICSQYFHNIFTINHRWQIVISCYYSDKKIILVLDLFIFLKRVKFKFEIITTNHLLFIIKIL